MLRLRRDHALRWLLLLAVITTGIVLRAAVLRSWAGNLNADEAYTGLQSLGVIRDGRFPVVIDGNTYSATIEAYLFAPLITVFSGGVLVLKALFIGMWGVAALTTAGAARRLIDNRAAAVAGSLVWLAPGALLVVSTRSYVCYGLGLAVVSATLWASAVVVDESVPRLRSSVVTGFLAGLAVYIHPMFLTVVAPCIVVVSVVHRRQVRRWWLPAALGGLFANLPFLAWNATNGWPSFGSGSRDLNGAPDRLRGFVERLLPRGFGLRAYDGTWVFGRAGGLLAYLAILLVVVIGCVSVARSSTRPSRWIVPAALGSCLFLMSPLVNLSYSDDGRYAIIPFALVAVAISAAVSKACAGIGPRRALLAVAATAVAWVAVTIVPFMQTQDEFDEGNANAWQEHVVRRLEEVEIDHLGGSYFLVLPIEYRSDRRITTAALGPLEAIRFPTSQRSVMNTPPEQVAFLLSGPAEESMLYLCACDYRVEVIDGFLLYLPPDAKV